MNIRTINKKGYNLHIIKTKKFKTLVLKVIFWNELKKEELSLANLLIDNLLFSSYDYKTKREFEIKKEDLYGIKVYGGPYIKGKNLITNYTLSCIEDKYTEKGNLLKAIEFFINCLTKPNVKDNKFDEETFNICKNQLLSAQIKEQENPGFIAHKKFREMLGEKEIFSGSYLGTSKDTEKITPESLYKYYKNLFKNNHIDIFIIGNVTDNIIKKIEEKLSLRENNIPYKKERITYQKEYSEKVVESSFNQSIIKMGASLKDFSEEELHYNLPIYSMILGNSPSSKLFQNVREKLSYAYFISSNLYTSQGILEINAGISSDNYESTKKEIINQINEMKKGNFTEKEITNSKQYILSTLKELPDSQMQIIDYYFNKLYFFKTSLE